MFGNGVIVYTYRIPINPMMVAKDLGRAKGSCEEDAFLLISKKHVVHIGLIAYRIAETEISVLGLSSQESLELSYFFKSI